MSVHPAVEERLARLAPDQRAAATAPPGPVLCVAPAGSGKTTTLVARICWLVGRGADPDEIDELDGWERPFAPFVAELDRLGMLLRGYLRGTVEKLHVEGLPDAVAAVFEDLDPDVREPLVTAGWNFIRAHHWR